MARFWGKIGYGHQVETRPGVYKDVITERECMGEVIADSVKMSSGDKVNTDLTLGNSFRVLADAYALENMSAIRYITWHGARWSVVDIKNQPPRLILRPGALYHGPIPTP